MGIYREFVTYPIINRGTGEYFGMAVASIPTISFFSHYDDVERIDSQFLVIHDNIEIV